MKLFCGIDCGVDGGIVFIDGDNKIVHKCVMPTFEKPTIRMYKGKHKKTMLRVMDLDDVKTIIQTYNKYNLFVVIERQTPMREQGLGSTAKTMYAFGELVGLMKGMDIDHRVVSAVSWKKYFSLLKTTKKDSVKKAHEFSGCDFVQLMCRVGHDGLAEAYLMAKYGMEVCCV